MHYSKPTPMYGVLYFNTNYYIIRKHISLNNNSLRQNNSKIKSSIIKSKIKLFQHIIGHSEMQNGRKLDAYDINFGLKQILFRSPVENTFSFVNVFTTFGQIRFHVYFSINFNFSSWGGLER